MKPITNPIDIELPIKDRGRRVIAQLTQDGITFRRKRTRHRDFAPWAVLYNRAQNYEALDSGVVAPQPNRKGRKKWKDAP